MQTEFKLRKKRSSSEMVSEVFNYLKIHIWNLFKALLIIVGPFYIIGGILVGQFYGDIFTMAESAVDPSAESFLVLIPAFLLLAVGGIFYQAAIVGYMKLSLDHSKEEITLQLLFAEIKQYFWRYFGANLLMGLGIGVTLGVVAGVLALVSPVLSVFVVMFGMIYLFVMVSIYPFPISVEGLSAYESIKRSFDLIRGNWWRTFGYYILLYFVQYFISLIVILPVYLVSFYRMFSDIIKTGAEPSVDQMGVIFSIIMPVIMFCSLFLGSFYLIGLGINYFTLVERKEEVGLAQEIEAMNTGETELAE